MDLSQLEDRIGYRFRDRTLFECALTHRSFSNEQTQSPPYNERLEFLGDAVLDLAVGEALFQEHPDMVEGELTRLRADLVNEQNLAAVARLLGLGEWLRLGRGEERSGGRDKPSLLANALEALLGAVFCDGGWEAARPLCRRLLEVTLPVHLDGGPFRDYKTRLQETLQESLGRPPVYELTGSSGPDHARLFTAEVCLDGRVLGSGTGRTKKAAEQEAAARALELLASQPELLRTTGPHK